MCLNYPRKVKVISIRCEMTKTQLDPRSSIRACLCTEDFCNHDEQGDGDYNDEALNRIFNDTTNLPIETIIIIFPQQPHQLQNQESNAAKFLCR